VVEAVAAALELVAEALVAAPELLDAEAADVDAVDVEAAAVLELVEGTQGFQVPLKTFWHVFCASLPTQVALEV